MSAYTIDERLLVGRTLESIAVSNGERALRLTTDAGIYYLDTEGDCCSESWWADVLGAKSNYGKKIIGVKSLPLPQDGQGRTRQEHDEVYGYALITEGGIVTLAFRNSSNGYYGGWVSGRLEEPNDYDGKLTWTEIVENDWRA